MELELLKALHQLHFYDQSSEEEAFQLAEAWGLCRLDEAKVTRAGEQFMDCSGKVDREVLSFLPVVDDLPARAALIGASRVLLRNYAEALQGGDGVEFTRALIPCAFESQVQEEDAYRFYAAAAGLCAQLSAGQLPGCIAEEIIMLSLMGVASSMMEESDRLTGEQAKQSEEAMGELTSRLGDNYALSLHKMKEPGDAALYSQQEGADLRFESWFEPLWGRASTGYLGP